MAYWRITFRLALLFAASFASESGANADQRGPYCGIYCAYAGLRASGIEVQFADLVDPKYVPTEHGSSVEDLCKAISDHGAVAVPLQGLGEYSLRTSADPIILHVRRPGYKSDFRHWVLFLGADSAGARILDPPGNLQIIPYSELLAVWDGIGVLLPRKTTSLWFVRLGALLSTAISLMIVVASLSVVKAVARNWQGKRSVQLISILATAALAACAVQCLAPSGLIRSPEAIGEVASRYFELDVHQVQTTEVRKAVGDPATLIVDCRFEPTFQRGHIPGAINLPVNWNTFQRQEVLSQLRHRGPIIVYCQNENCHWARQIAGDLCHRGFSDVSVYRDGWNGWSAAVTNSKNSHE